MRLQQAFRMNFRTDMQNVQPRFALTGFDQAYFFLRGLHKYGKTFNGARGMLGYNPVQTPLQFERFDTGGQKNKMVEVLGNSKTRQNVKYIGVKS